jgi:translation initiation factor IF-3
MTEVDLSRNVDLEVAMNRTKGLLVSGKKIKLRLRFRGRELADTKPGYNRFEKALFRLSSLGKPEAEPKLIGRSLVVVVAPVYE